MSVGNIKLPFLSVIFTFIGNSPVIVKRAVIGSKGGWKLSTIFLSCQVFHDWSKIKI